MCNRLGVSRSLFGCGLEINSHICSLSGIPELRERMSHDARYLANSLTVVQQAFGEDAATIWVRRRVHLM